MHVISRHIGYNIREWRTIRPIRLIIPPRFQRRKRHVVEFCTITDLLISILLEEHQHRRFDQTQQQVQPQVVLFHNPNLVTRSMIASFRKCFDGRFQNVLRSSSLCQQKSDRFRFGAKWSVSSNITTDDLFPWYSGIACRFHQPYAPMCLRNEPSKLILTNSW